ncbi:protein kinase domain-containing protein, partial [Lactococcus garvieae]|uniref:protein kinase domain-containing protein n=1 Tax=Lactococcus garvieae TaxID=1363 RepID=UPI00254A59A1
EYTMEYMDYSLEQYISKYNNTIEYSKRKRLGTQILNAFNYIHSKDILHRDISPKNVLLKVYDDVDVIKIADFGLVKIPDSGLTAFDTELKGAFNDPALSQEGFKYYSMVHETYALTKLLYFILTGRTKINSNKIGNENLKTFVSKGTNIDKKQRFQNVKEMIPYFNKINLE